MSIPTTINASAAISAKTSAHRVMSRWGWASERRRDAILCALSPTLDAPLCLTCCCLTRLNRSTCAKCPRNSSSADTIMCRTWGPSTRPMPFTMTRTAPARRLYRLTSCFLGISHMSNGSGAQRKTSMRKMCRAISTNASMGRYVDTDYDKCIGCHICEDVCPSGYVQMGLGV